MMGVCKHRDHLTLKVIVFGVTTTVSAPGSSGGTVLYNRTVRISGVVRVKED
jgi:hypothetical protein